MWKKIESNALLILQELTLQEAETIALSILKQVMEEKVWHVKLLHIPSHSSVEPSSKAPFGTAHPKWLHR